MNEKNFYGPNGYAQAVAFEAEMRAAGHQTCLIGHPQYATNTVRWWGAA